MRSLSAFMAGAVKPVENQLYAASKRIIDPETGGAERWEIKCISADENKRIRKSCVRTMPSPGGRKGQYTQELDADAYQGKIAAACTVFPDLQNAELQDSYHVTSPEALLVAMLTPGEYEDYTAEVFVVNGFTNDKGELVAEAKN